MNSAFNTPLENNSDQSDLETDSNHESDTESGSSNSEPSVHIEFMSENPEDLRKYFRQLFDQLSNIETYNKLMYILHELGRKKCLSKEECVSMNKYLQVKIGI